MGFSAGGTDPWNSSCFGSLQARDGAEVEDEPGDKEVEAEGVRAVASSQPRMIKAGSILERLEEQPKLNLDEEAKATGDKTRASSPGRELEAPAPAAMAEQESLLGALPGLPAPLIARSGGDALGPGDGPLETNWKLILPGEIGELADRAQRRAEQRRKRQHRKQKDSLAAELLGSEQLPGVEPLEGDSRPRRRKDKKRKKKKPGVEGATANPLGLPGGRPARYNAFIPNATSAVPDYLAVYSVCSAKASAAAQAALAAVEGAGDAAFAQRDEVGGRDSVVAEAVKGVEVSRTSRPRPADTRAEKGWMKPMLFEPAPDGGLRPEEVSQALRQQIETASAWSLTCLKSLRLKPVSLPGDCWPGRRAPSWKRKWQRP